MSASLKKFVSRAPRYTLRPSDNHYLRFAQTDDAGHVHTTRFVDISLTGLAFITDRENAPFIFDQIKVEIPLHDGKQIAWWAKVVRVEEYTESKWYMNKELFQDENSVLVAVTFKDMPVGHMQVIKETLDRKFTEVENDRKKERMQTVAAIWSHHAWQIVLYLACTIFTFWILWYFSQPDFNYDSQRGTPWGERFFSWPSK